MKYTIFFLTSAAAVLTALPLWGAEPTVPDQYWFLIHDRAVLAELKLTTSQRQALLKVTDELDLRFMPLRGSTPERAAEGVQSLAAEAHSRLKAVLKPEQQRRIGEIAMRVQGTSALLRADVAQQMAYAAGQKAKLEQIISETKTALAALDKQSNEGKSVDKERKELQTREQTRLLEVLTKPQQAKWRELLGPTFETTKLGKGAFKAPELAIGKDWINSEPPRLGQLRGQVAVVHFYACGCINCIHNYPSYRTWQDELAGKPVAIIGIHTPETSGERVVETVRKKAKEEQLAFPIVIDNDKENWNAWGNTMWPTVYLVDKQGYVRYWWMGELNWQGAQGEKLMRQRIDELLAE